MKRLWCILGKWPFFTSVLRQQVLMRGLLLVGVVYLVFSFFEISLWRCGWRVVTGWRCPGCGLTTGCKAFLRGNFEEAMRSNWLTPGVIFGLLLSSVVLALPKRRQELVFRWFEGFEKGSRLLFWVFLVVFLQSIARWKGWA